MTRFVISMCLSALICSSTFADFIVGDEGCCDAEVNQWPGGEPPAAAIDGAGQKYLNFGRENTGFIVNPGSDGVVDGIKLWAANDAIPRDPASYQLWGTNETTAGAVGGLVVPGTTIPTSAFTLISSGGLALPDSRNDGGTAALDDANSQTVSFANSTAYDAYILLFPTVKDGSAANSMQIAEVQLLSGGGGILVPTDPIAGGQFVPEPSTLGLLGIAFCGLLGFRRRR